MNAVVYHGRGDVRVEQIAAPRCEPGGLLVEVDACAVCGTDLKAFHHGNPRIRAPLVMGHEFTGRICQAGAATEGFAVGGRIVMATSVSCGDCAYCQAGWRNLCVDLAPMGFGYPGGMARYVAIPPRAVHNGHVVKVPERLPPEQAALAEPLSCAVNCLENCGLRSGDTVVIVGGGPMGLMNLCVARQLGAAQVLLAEISPRRRAMAGPFAADRLIDPAAEDLVAAVMEATGGRGADVAIVAAPAAEPQETALRLVRKRGTVCLFASLPAEHSTLQVDSRAIHYGELRLVGTSDSTPRHVQQAVEILTAGQFPAERFVTHVLPLEEVLTAFELMASGEALRVVLKP